MKTFFQERFGAQWPVLVGAALALSLIGIAVAADAAVDEANPSVTTSDLGDGFSESDSETIVTSSAASSSEASSSMVASSSEQFIPVVAPASSVVASSSSAPSSVLSSEVSSQAPSSAPASSSSDDPEESEEASDSEDEPFFLFRSSDQDADSSLRFSTDDDVTINTDDTSNSHRTQINTHMSITTRSDENGAVTEKHEEIEVSNDGKTMRWTTRNDEGSTVRVRETMNFDAEDENDGEGADPSTLLRAGDSEDDPTSLITDELRRASEDEEEELEDFLDSLND